VASADDADVAGLDVERLGVEHQREALASGTASQQIDCVPVEQVREEGNAAPARMIPELFQSHSRLDVTVVTIALHFVSHACDDRSPPDISSCGSRRTA
jgi:hypothetical protein